MTDEEIIRQSDKLQELKYRMKNMSGISAEYAELKNCYVALAGILAAIQRQTDAIDRLTSAVYSVMEGRVVRAG